MTAPDLILRLCAAGPLSEIVRVGHAPLGGDDAIEIRFACGKIFSADVGAMDAMDICLCESSYLDRVFGHLRAEDRDAFAAIERDWTHAALDLPWAIGQVLSAPRRLTMTQPYRVDVGYVFDCGGREFALFGESDFIFATALDDPGIATFALEVRAL